MRTAGAVSTPVTETHRWGTLPHWRHRQPYTFDPDVREFLWRLRWRPPPRQPKRTVILVVAVLLLHVAGWVGLRQGMRPSPVVARAATASVIEVQLIEPPEVAPSPAPLQQTLPPLTVRSESGTAVAEVRVSRDTAPVVETPEVIEHTEPAMATARIYDASGRVMLPAGVSSAPATPGYRVVLPQATPGLMEHKSPVTYTPTRFEKDWVPADENALEAAVRKTVMEATVLPLPGGHKVKCVISPLTLGFGCGIDGPHQLSAPLEVKHERDNLAPATPLVAGKQSAEPAPAGTTHEAATASSVAPAASATAVDARH